MTLTMEVSLSWTDARIVVMNLPEYNETLVQKTEVLGKECFKINLSQYSCLMRMNDVQ